MKVSDSWYSDHSRRYLVEMTVRFDLFSIIQIYNQRLLTDVRILERHLNAFLLFWLFVIKFCLRQIYKSALSFITVTRVLLVWLRCLQHKLSVCLSWSYMRHSFHSLHFSKEFQYTPKIFCSIFTNVHIREQQVAKYILVINIQGHLAKYWMWIFKCQKCGSFPFP